MKVTSTVVPVGPSSSLFQLILWLRLMIGSLSIIMDYHTALSHFKFTEITMTVLYMGSRYAKQNK